jgi:hypothetical protein
MQHKPEYSNQKNLLPHSSKGTGNTSPKQQAHHLQYHHSAHLEFSGITETGKQILQGDTSNITTNPFTQSVLQELQQARPVLPHFMPMEDMIKGSKKRKENTTTSPSGKHLGIYKSLTRYHKHATQQLQKKSNGETFSDTAYIALKIQHQIINLAIKQTHSLERWQKVHNFFIEKIPGHPLLDKLRIIHIYEADWNLLLKYFIAYKLTHTDIMTKNTTRENFEKHTLPARQIPQSSLNFSHFD